MNLSRSMAGRIRYDGADVYEWFRTVRANAHMRACQRALPRLEWSAFSRKGFAIVTLKFGGNLYSTGVDLPCGNGGLSDIIRGLTIEALNDVIKSNQDRLDR